MLKVFNYLDSHFGNFGIFCKTLWRDMQQTLRLIWLYVHSGSRSVWSLQNRDWISRYVKGFINNPQ